MKANRSVSRLELRFRKALRLAGATGYRVSMRLPGKPDIAFPRGRVAIFVHGCFWHQCPMCNLPQPKASREFWAAKFAENKLRDVRAEQRLAAEGWRAVVVWEHEIRVDLPGAVQRTIALLDGREAWAATTSEPSDERRSR
jgi:DNA mismatch endonuclease, patch repair protein